MQTTFLPPTGSNFAHWATPTVFDHVRIGTFRSTALQWDVHWSVVHPGIMSNCVPCTQCGWQQSHRKSQESERCCGHSEPAVIAPTPRLERAWWTRSQNQWGRGLLHRQMLTFMQIKKTSYIYIYKHEYKYNIYIYIHQEYQNIQTWTPFSPTLQRWPSPSPAVQFSNLFGSV